jgi:putative intracellular protease/amidase
LLRTSALRTLGAYANVFALESFMDELAAAAGADPVEFGLRHMKDPRARAVIEAAALAFSKYKNLTCYVALVADVTVGAVPRFVAARLGQVTGADGETLEADVTIEAMPSVLFDAVVVPGGASEADARASDGQSLEFVKDQYRHCKPMLMLGESSAILLKSGIPPKLPSGDADPGLVLAEAFDAHDRGLQGRPREASRVRAADRSAARVSDTARAAHPAPRGLAGGRPGGSAEEGELQLDGNVVRVDHGDDRLAVRHACGDVLHRTFAEGKPLLRLGHEVARPGRGVVVADDAAHVAAG